MSVLVCDTALEEGLGRSLFVNNVEYLNGYSIYIYIHTSHTVGLFYDLNCCCDLSAFRGLELLVYCIQM